MLGDLLISKNFVKEFATNPKVQIWDGEGPNPHMEHLAWADAFVITADSVSMLSEACSTRKPVYVIGAEICTWKFADFQNSLQKQWVARPFTRKENSILERIASLRLKGRVGFPLCSRGMAEGNGVEAFNNSER